MESENTLMDLPSKVREIGPGIREHSSTAEAERRLSEPAYRAMRDAGLDLIGAGHPDVGCNDGLDVGG